MVFLFRFLTAQPDQKTPLPFSTTQTIKIKHFSPARSSRCSWKPHALSDKSVVPANIQLLCRGHGWRTQREKVEAESQ